MRIPLKEKFSKQEWALIQQLNTPEKVQKYLYAIPYNHEKKGETLYSFRQVVRHHTAHCLEGAVFAAAILERYGYPPLLLDMESKDDIDHVLFLFKENGRYGTVGTSKDIGLYGRRPLFKTIRSLVSSYYDPYINFKACVTGYATADLRDTPLCDWRFSSKNLSQLEQYLIDLPHKPFLTSKKRYFRELNEYKAFKKAHPHREPPVEAYENRHEWWDPSR